jgi:hypothetical protein
MNVLGRKRLLGVVQVVLSRSDPGGFLLRVRMRRQKCQEVPGWRPDTHTFLLGKIRLTTMFEFGNSPTQDWIVYRGTVLVRLKSKLHQNQKMGSCIGASIVLLNRERVNNDMGHWPFV